MGEGMRLIQSAELTGHSLPGFWVAVEHEHPVFVELEFRSLPGRLYTTPLFGWWCFDMLTKTRVPTHCTPLANARGAAGLAR